MRQVQSKLYATCLQYFYLPLSKRTYIIMKKHFLGFIALLVLSFICLSCTQKITNFEYSSKFYKIQLSDTAPFIRYFSIDALGYSELSRNTIKWDKLSNK